MRVDLEALRNLLEPITTVHGVELVALEWLQGPGHGVFRVYIDLPGGDPRLDPATTGRQTVSADLCARVSRDVSAVLDEDEETLPGSYDLEVSSPGFERPVQLRKDFDRFAGMSAKFKLRAAIEGRTALDAVLVGTRDLGDGAFGVVVRGQGRELVLSASTILRANLVEPKAPPKAKPGKGPRRAKGAAGELMASAPAAPSGAGAHGDDPR